MVDQCVEHVGCSRHWFQEIAFVHFTRDMQAATFSLLQAPPDTLSRFSPLILISIWQAAIPFFVPTTLKSISPR